MNEARPTVRTNEVSEAITEDQLELLEGLKFCVLPRDESKIHITLNATKEIRKTMLENECSIKKCFPIFIAHPQLVGPF